MRAFKRSSVHGVMVHESDSFWREDCAIAAASQTVSEAHDHQFRIMPTVTKGKVTTRYGSVTSSGDVVFICRKAELTNVRSAAGRRLNEHQRHVIAARRKVRGVATILGS